MRLQDSSRSTHRVLMSCCSSFCRSVVTVGVLGESRCSPAERRRDRPGPQGPGERPRRTARSKHSVVGCRCAPRPGARPSDRGGRLVGRLRPSRRPRATTRSSRPAADSRCRSGRGPVRAGSIDGRPLGSTVRRVVPRPRARWRALLTSPGFDALARPRTSVASLAQPGRTHASVVPHVAVVSSSDRMSIRQPVRRAARRAFWPSLPMASDSWKSGTTTRADLGLGVDDRRPR